MMTPADRVSKTALTTLHQMPARGSHEWQTILEILDEGLHCTVALVREGQPYAFTVLYGRDGNHLYMHGAPGSHVQQAAEHGARVCVNVNLLDGFAFGRAAVAHDAHYRSVMIFGTPQPVTDPDERRHALQVITDHVSPGLWEGTRQPTQQEASYASLLRLEIEEVSAKLSEAFPKDPDADLASEHWAGKVFLHTVASSEPAPDLRPDIPRPGYVPDGDLDRRL